MIAANRGSSPVVQLLLSKGATTSATDGDGFTALTASAQAGRLAVVGLLIRAGADLEAVTCEGATALVMAVTSGHTEVIRALVRAGANVDSRRPNGATPLVEAAMRGRIDPVRELLRANANPQITMADPTGNAGVALDVASQYGHLQVVRELIEQVGIGGCGGPSGGNEALRWAAHEQHLDIMILLMEAGAVDRGTALIAAAQYGRAASIKLLLQHQQWRRKSERSAVVNTRDVCGRTPLACSILFSTSPKLARMLVDAGATTTSAVSVTNSAGMVGFNGTPLVLASSILKQKSIAGRDATEEQLHGLEGIRRLLLTVEAVHAVSWLWASPAPVFPVHAEGEGKRNTTTSAPLAVISPILQRRVARRGVLLATLFRLVVT